MCVQILLGIQISFEGFFGGPSFVNPLKLICTPTTFGFFGCSIFILNFTFRIFNLGFWNLNLEWKFGICIFNGELVFEFSILNCGFWILNFVFRTSDYRKLFSAIFFSGSGLGFH